MEPVKVLTTILAGWIFVAWNLAAQVPPVLNYQGRLAVAGTPVNGTVFLKFALVNELAEPATVTYWSHDGSSVAGAEPLTAITVSVSKGLCSVRLGDTTLENMTIPVSPDVLAHPDVRLRVWFSQDGSAPFSLLAPDQRLTAVSYALLAETVAQVPAAAISGQIADSQLPATVARLDGDAVFAGRVSANGGFTGDGSGIRNISPVTSGLDSYVQTEVNRLGSSWVPRIVLPT